MATGNFYNPSCMAKLGQLTRAVVMHAKMDNITSC